MAQAVQMPLTTTIVANDKLLKALITLLSLKDEHLLDELTAVFMFASQAGADGGEGSEATLARVRQELASIAEIIDERDEPSPVPVFDS